MLAAELDYLLDVTKSGQVKKAKAERKALSHYGKSPGHWKTGYGKRLETTEIAGTKDAGNSRRTKPSAGE